MKKMKKYLFVLLVAFNLSAVAQEQLLEGVIASKMTMSSESPEVQAQLAMIGDINSVTYFKDNKTRTEVNNPMTGEAVNIIDSEAKKMLVMMNNPMAGGKQYAIKDITQPSEEDLKGMTITKTDETKTILGYVCNVYHVVMSKDGVNMTMDIFSTEKINAVNQQTTTFSEEFKGFPMYMKMTMNQMGMDIIMINEVTEVKGEAVDAEKFNMTPLEGYKKVDKIQGM